MRGKAQLLALVRHGQSEANASLLAETDEFYYSMTGSDVDISLTHQGHSEALHAGLQLLKLFPAESPIDCMYLSRHRRVQQSGTGIAHALGYQPACVIDKRLEKRSYGDFWNLTYRGVEHLHPEEYARFQEQGPLLYRPPNGENYPDVFNRVQNFADEVLQPSTGNLLVVTHAVVVLAFQRLFEGLPDHELLRLYEGMSLPNGHVVLYSRQAPGAPWQRFSDTAG